MLTILLVVAAWFVTGYLYAPRSAANCYKTYQHSPNYYGHRKVASDNDRKKSAKIGYAVSLWLGPVILAYWILRLQFFRPLKQKRGERLHKALVTHVPEVRQAEYDKLVAENDRLTREILGEPEPVQTLKVIGQEPKRMKGRRVARAPFRYSIEGD